ncbi:interleukin-13 receptor subunit alpha-1 [Anomalospiza imberbis]|uniref:interleukin-13 receptor subunit alpha-1 n=1 Tax=Anomalospiza imberbis TaxID=187417 RepID=UPI00358FEAE9
MREAAAGGGERRAVQGQHMRRQRGDNRGRAERAVRSRGMLPSLHSPAARGGAAQVAGPGRPSRPARITWAGRPVPSRPATPALPGWSGPLTGSGSEGPRWGGRAMAVPATAPPPCPLLLAVCWVVAAGMAAGGKILPSPSILNYSFIHICTLNWTWNPPGNISSGCNLEYSSDIVINGVPEDRTEWSKSRFRVTDAHLNEEMRLRVRSECKNDNTSEPSPWVETSLLPKGIPGTAAVDLGCVWHNLEYMACTWRRGENASSDTNYTLFYWFDGLENPKKCSNSSINQGIFECIFNLSFPKVTSTYPTISILIRDDSEEVRPVCASKNPTTLVKPATPRQLTLTKTNDRIDVKWSESETFPKSCLHYEVKCCNGDCNMDIGQIIASEMNSVSIAGIDANSKYTFKVRAKAKRECYNSDLHSDWSEEKSIGEKKDSTIYFVLIITIPLTVAVSTVILLIYLKRLKILILPPIPDPREILKRMFGEQNEDSQSSAKDDPMNAFDRLIIEEEIHSLILTETSESTNPEKENR